MSDRWDKEASRVRRQLQGLTPEQAHNLLVSELRRSYEACRQDAARAVLDVAKTQPRGGFGQRICTRVWVAIRAMR